MGNTNLLEKLEPLGEKLQEELTVNEGFANTFKHIEKELFVLNPLRQEEIPLDEWCERADKLGDLLDDIYAKLLMKNLKKVEETTKVEEDEEIPF